MEPVAIIITNYNMPERTDALCEHINKYVEWPHSLIVVDNGSDLIAPSQYTTIYLDNNIQTTGGLLAGLEYADNLSVKRGVEYSAYWFLITSAAFIGASDPLTPLMWAMIHDDNMVGIHPALTPDSTTAWQHLIKRDGGGLRQTWMIDNIASLYRAAWLDSIGRFDRELVYAWGIDLETCWKARRDGRGLYICEDVQVQKISNIGYDMGRMNMSADERAIKAGINMHAILEKRYGRDWNNRMRYEYVTNIMV